jgi:SpoIIAA-like
MIERLSESNDKAIGFRVTGRVTAEEVEVFAGQVGFAIGKRGKRRVGILADLAGLEGVDWKARLKEVSFLKSWADQIERVAIVGAHSWEEVMAEILGSTVLVEAETRYFPSAEILHAWHWVKTGQSPDAPVRRVYPREGLMADYVPEYSEE